MRCSQNAYSTTVSRFLKGLPKYHKTKRLAGLRLNDYVCRSKTIGKVIGAKRDISYSYLYTQDDSSDNGYIFRG